MDFVSPLDYDKCIWRNISYNAIIKRWLLTQNHFFFIKYQLIITEIPRDKITGI
jgi:hypothetical protein